MFYERSRQLATPRKKEKYYMNGQEIEDQFHEIKAGLYGDTKTDDEFHLGLALISVLDSLDNPDQYDSDALNFVHTNADELAAYFRFKYDQEIKALNKDSGLNE